MRLGLALGLLATASLLLAPTAMAHTSTTTDDGAYRIVVGNLNEPATTFMKTGLDLILQTNDEARSPVVTNPGNLTATLVAPDGVTTLTQGLHGQHGKPGSYTFESPYYLTQPGQYTLRLVGHIEGSPVDKTINVAGPLTAMETVTFPDVGLSTPLDIDATIADLQADLAALEAENAALESRLAALEAKKDDQGIPGPAVALLIAGLAGLAILRRRA